MVFWGLFVEFFGKNIAGIKKRLYFCSPCFVENRDERVHNMKRNMIHDMKPNIKNDTELRNGRTTEARLFAGRSQGVAREQARSKHTLGILKEYAMSMARVWLEYAKSMARV